VRRRRKPEPTPLSSKGPAGPEPSGEGTAKGIRRSFASLDTRSEPGGVRSEGNRKEAGYGLRSNAWLSGDRQGLPWRRPGKGSIEVRFDGSPWEPGRSFGFGREPEREPTGAARPRPEPDPRKGGSFGRSQTADSGGRQRCRPPFAFGGWRFTLGSASATLSRAASAVAERTLPQLSANDGRDLQQFSVSMARFGRDAKTPGVTLPPEAPGRRRTDPISGYPPAAGADLRPPGRLPTKRNRGAPAAASDQAASGSPSPRQARAACSSQARGALPKWRRKAWQSETESE